ncbi:hypothetical protein ABC977_08890 [Thioalkalicoccus limnaeus]|uniref:N-acetyltransferase domain-containing protein n=1 Tax=Thioalkalicoccus limnaeus TaxID=120681 RepID=A0ABV4BFE8_9GAMM
MQKARLFQFFTMKNFLEEEPDQKRIREFLLSLAYLDKKTWEKNSNLIPEYHRFRVSNFFSHMHICPDLQFLTLKDRKLSAILSLLRVQESRLQKMSSWEEITEDGSFLSHHPYGDFIFAARLSLDPSERTFSLARAMINIPFRKTVSENGARGACVAVENNHREISFFQRQGFEVIRVAQHFLPGGGKIPENPRRDAVIMVRKSLNMVSS